MCVLIVCWNIWNKYSAKRSRYMCVFVCVGFICGYVPLYVCVPFSVHLEKCECVDIHEEIIMYVLCLQSIWEMYFSMYVHICIEVCINLYKRSHTHGTTQERQ
jgi:hypothetical protein